MTSLGELRQTAGSRSSLPDERKLGPSLAVKLEAPANQTVGKAAEERREQDQLTAKGKGEVAHEHLRQADDGDAGRSETCHTRRARLSERSIVDRREGGRRAARSARARTGQRVVALVSLPPCAPPLVADLLSAI